VSLPAPGRCQLLLALLLAAGLTAAVPAQVRGRCTVCGNDPALLARNGYGHGPFPFGRSDSAAIEKDFFWKPVWIETPHFRLALDLPSWKVPERERKAYRAELTRLKERWPAIKPKARTLDPWLRAHLLADRVERFYADFQELVGRSEESFWDADKNYLQGLGPYLGMHEKYEVMVFQQEGPFREYMERTWGLTYVKPQRWNIIDRKCLWFGMNLEQEHVRHDQYLHNIVLHNLAINLLNGYLFYGFDMPIWIKEGLAHWAARRNDPRFNSFDTVEGAFVEKKSLERWAPEVRKLVAKDKAASFASLLRRMSFAELSFDDHLIVWSKVQFLIEHDREKFGRFLTVLKGRRTAAGIPDGSKLDDAQREAFKDIWGWTLQQAERHWVDWVLATYPVK